MANMHEVMRRALEDHDVSTARRLWAVVMPKMPQPRSEHEATVILHIACTQTPTVKFKSRAYSHQWLLERGLPSSLPDNLRPKAQRMYPVIADVIGIACGNVSEAMKPVVPIVRGAMEDVVMDHYADGVKDPTIIKPRMLDARKKAIKKLFG